MKNCTHCGKAIKGSIIEEPDGAVLHDDCVLQYRRFGIPKVKKNGVILTTAHSVIGRKMLREVDIVSAECVFGSNIFRDFLSGARDLVGGRAKGQQNILRDAKSTCMRELEQAAAECGADAVIGVDLDYQEISGGGKSMLFLVASGTAVVLAPSQD